MECTAEIDEPTTDVVSAVNRQFLLLQHGAEPDWRRGGEGHCRDAEGEHRSAHAGVSGWSVLLRLMSQQLTLCRPSTPNCLLQSVRQRRWHRGDEGHCRDAQGEHSPEYAGVSGWSVLWRLMSQQLTLCRPSTGNFSCCSMGRNQIGDEGTKAIAEMLKANTALHALE